MLHAVRNPVNPSNFLLQHTAKQHKQSAGKGQELQPLRNNRISEIQETWALWDLPWSINTLIKLLIYDLP